MKRLIEYFYTKMQPASIKTACKSYNLNPIDYSDQNVKLGLCDFYDDKI